MSEEILARLDRLIWLVEQQNRSMGARRKPPAPSKPLDPTMSLASAIHQNFFDPPEEPRGEDEIGPDPLPPSSTRLPRQWTKGVKE